MDERPKQSRFAQFVQRLTPKSSRAAEKQPEIAAQPPRPSAPLGAHGDRPEIAPWEELDPKQQPQRAAVPQKQPEIAAQAPRPSAPLGARGDRPDIAPWEELEPTQQPQRDAVPETAEASRSTARRLRSMNSQVFRKAAKGLEAAAQRLTPKSSRAGLRDTPVAGEAPPVPEVPRPSWAAAWDGERVAGSANAGASRAESDAAPQSQSQSKASGLRLRTFKSMQNLRSGMTISRGAGLSGGQVRGFEEWASRVQAGGIPARPDSPEALTAEQARHERVAQAVQRYNDQNPERRQLLPPSSVDAWDFKQHTGSYVELRSGGLAVHTGQGKYQEVGADQRHLIEVQEHGISLSQVAQSAQQRGRSVVPDRQASAESQQVQRSRSQSRGSMSR
jgi:hypothetical protein